MFCPECKSEYEPGFYRCKDCDVALVDRLPGPDPVKYRDAPGPVYSDYVVVSVVNGPFEEEQIRSFLEANDIPVQIRGEAVRKSYGLTVDGIGAAEIVVPREFEAAARDLLRNADAGKFTIDGGDE